MLEMWSAQTYALSRRPPTTSEEAKCLDHTPEYVLYTDFLASKAITAQELVHLTDSDATLQQVRQYIVKA